MSKPKTAITPTRAENFPEWYQEVIKAADMAENSPTRGCMVIKPHGYAIWENVQKYVDGKIKEIGVQNAYFPLLIPLEYISREAEHIDGFATECAVVTHHRLEKGPDGSLVPSGELSEPFIVRPTSETIIGESMSKWIRSYRDLPLQLNQWANVLRWEMRPRLFLRTAEFLWQEGHSAFKDEEDALKNTLQILDIYTEFAEHLLAIPVIPGEKTEDERFPGAFRSFTVEAMMQDGKALQFGTSHYLGTTFSKGWDIKYQDETGQEQFCHTNSWAISTRSIGGMIMVHADDDGLRLPPRVAPVQAVILPFLKGDENDEKISAYCEELEEDLKGIGIRVKFDNREMRNGDKMWEHIKKGTPVRIEVGLREIDNNQVTVTRRDLGRDSKATSSRTELLANIHKTLESIQSNLFDQALSFMQENITDVSGVEEMDAYFSKPDAIGFVKAPVSVLTSEAFKALKDKHKISPRCMPFSDNGKTVVIGKAY